MVNFSCHVVYSLLVCQTWGRLWVENDAFLLKLNCHAYIPINIQIAKTYPPSRHSTTQNNKQTQTTVTRIKNTTTTPHKTNSHKNSHKSKVVILRIICSQELLMLGALGTNRTSETEIWKSPPRHHHS